LDNQNNGSSIINIKILDINLTTGEIASYSPDEQVLKDYLGGRGLNAWLLFNNTKPGEHTAFDEGNVIIFGAGLLANTVMPASNRLTVTSLNALNSAYGESSSSGYFALEMKRAGYSHIIIRGKAEFLSYLFITQGRIEIRRADHLAGKTTYETDRIIKEELEDEGIKTCTIGPAGEKLVRYSVINVTNRYCGRCGMGAVMGSKNLKAVAVKGQGALFKASQEYLDYAKRINNSLKRSAQAREIRTHGMAATSPIYKSIQGIRNFQSVGFKGIESIGGYEKVSRYYNKVLNCPNCLVRCDREVIIPEEEPYGGTRVSSMQASPAYNFAHFLIEDINTVIKGFELCNAYGIDVQSWSTVVQWAIEGYDRKQITPQETDNLVLKWGDGELLLKLIEDISLRKTFLGDLLAEGVYEASRRLGRGSEQYAMQMKRMEIDDDLRVCKGWSLGVMTEIRGPGHVLGALYSEIESGFMTPEEAERLYGYREAVIPESYNNKPELVVLTERMSAVEDSLGFCNFITQHSNPEYMKEFNVKYGSQAINTRIINSAMGWNLSEEEIDQTAERILTLEKCINVLAGIKREDDFPPERFHTPISEGEFKGIYLDKGELDRMLRKHDSLHGWDEETGIPNKETLERLKLKISLDRKSG